jgi:hypothetical protein
MATLVKIFQKLPLGPLQSLFLGSPSGEISPKKTTKTLIIIITYNEKAKQNTCAKTM